MHLKTTLINPLYINTNNTFLMKDYFAKQKKKKMSAEWVLPFSESP